ncbi:hypothetical protein E2320_014175, partial [Naja naja]
CLTLPQHCWHHALLNVPWEELQELLCKHSSPKSSCIARHQAFRRWTQAEGETISGYMAALRTAALHSGFRDYLEDMLLDQLVCGLRDLRLQSLLAKGDLTLPMALEESQAAKMSALTAAEPQGSPINQNSSAVHYDEASDEEGPEEFRDINRLRQPKNSQRGNKPIPTQPPQSQPICLRCGGDQSFLQVQQRNWPKMPEERAFSQDLPGRKHFHTIPAASDNPTFSQTNLRLIAGTLLNVPWEELQELLCKHSSPKSSCIARHQAFRRWTQAEGETISGYMAALRTAALHSGFRDYLEDMLLDQLVCGLRDLRLQRRLLAKGDLTLPMALEESQAAKMSALTAAEPQGSPINQNSSAVHYDEASDEEGPEEFRDINRLRQPKTVRGKQAYSTQPPQSQPICLRCGGDQSFLQVQQRNWPKMPEERAFSQDLPGRKHFHTIPAASDNPTFSQTNLR